MGLRDFLALPPVGPLASVSHFREEEEDKMLEAMIKKKGEASLGHRPIGTPGGWGQVAERVGVDSTGWRVPTPSFCVVGRPRVARQASP